MDLKTFLEELFSALANTDFVEDIDIKSEGIILSGRVSLQKNIFLNIYYNQLTGTIAFALIKKAERIWGIDKDNLRGWHLHPLGNASAHEPVEPLSIREIVKQIKEIWPLLQDEDPY